MPKFDQFAGKVAAAISALAVSALFMATAIAPATHSIASSGMIA